MRYNCKIQCPKCSNIFKVEVDTDSPAIVDNLFPTKCTNCDKSIKVKISEDHKYSCYPESKATGFEITKRVTRTPGPYQPDGAGQDDLPFKISPQLYRPNKTDKATPTPVKPWADNKKLKGSTPPGSRSRFARRNKRAEDMDLSSYSTPPPSVSSRKPMKAQSALKIAFVLLIFVFILGAAHGANSLIVGTNEPIKTESDEPGTVDIQGKVIDFEQGTPISNCKITIANTGQSTITSDDGQYFLPNVEIGVHDIKAELNGYKKIIKKVTVDPELLGSVNFELKAGGGEQTMDESVVIGDRAQRTVNFFGLMIIIFSCFALVSAFLIKRRNLFGLCVISAFISILSIGAFIGTFLGIIALMLIMMSRTEFDKGLRKEEVV